MTQADLQTLFTQTFPTAKYTDAFETLALNSVPEWDSLGNLNWLLRVEETAETRFSSEELSEIKSISQLVQVLKAKGVYED